MPASAFSSMRRLSSTPAVHAQPFTGHKIAVKQLTFYWGNYNLNFNRNFMRQIKPDEPEEPELVELPEDGRVAPVNLPVNLPELPELPELPAQYDPAQYIPSSPTYSDDEVDVVEWTPQESDDEDEEHTRKRGRHDSPLFGAVVTVHQRIAASLAKAHQEGKVICLDQGFEC